LRNLIPLKLLERYGFTEHGVVAFVRVILPFKSIEELLGM